MDAGKLFTDTLSNVNLWGAIIATILIIGIGWALVKVKWFKVEWKDALISLVVKVTYPALVLKSFMTTTYQNQFSGFALVLGLSIAFYVIGCGAYIVWSRYALPKIAAARSKGKSIQLSAETEQQKLDKSVNMWMMCIFGSTVFFGTPVINALFGSEGLVAQALWITPYTIGLASFCQFQYMGLKFNKSEKKRIKAAFISPLIICTFLGLILWLTQLIPGSIIDVPNVVANGTDAEGKEVLVGWIYNGVKINNQAILRQGVWWFDLQYTAPFLFKTVDFVQALTSPLIWVAIGATIANNKLKAVVVDKQAWIYTGVKLLIIPAFMMLIVGGIGTAGNLFKFSMDASGAYKSFNGGPAVNSIAVITVLMSTPPATVCVAYAIQTNRDPQFAANASILSTLFTPILIPMWVAFSGMYADQLGLIAEYVEPNTGTDAVAQLPEALNSINLLLA